MNRTHREAGCPELSGEALERHLFVCEACRDDARMASAWKALAESPEGAEAPRQRGLPVAALRRAAPRRARLRLRRYLLAAAAVLLFFFAAGTSQSARGTVDTDRPPEEAFSSLASTSVLEGLLPE